MTENHREPALMSQAAQEILETMFFATAEDASEPEPWPAGLMTTELRFEGALSGWFSIHVQEACARTIAANFAGVMAPDELNPDTLVGVLCELANMVCGATLSRLEPDAIFNLSSPHLVLEPCPHDYPGGLRQWLRLDEGFIGLQLRLENSR
jgi:CheY-specific phosphatase CheX